MKLHKSITNEYFIRFNNDLPFHRWRQLNFRQDKFGIICDPSDLTLSIGWGDTVEDAYNHMLKRNGYATRTS